MMCDTFRRFAVVEFPSFASRARSTGRESLLWGLFQDLGGGGVMEREEGDAGCLSLFQASIG